MAISLIFAIGIVGSLAESARVTVAREVVLDSSYLSLQNVLAEYQRELWNDYHVFFVDASALDGDDGIKKLANEHLKEMIHFGKEDYLKTEAVFQSVRMNESMTEGSCRYFVKQAVKFMKINAPASLVSKALGNLKQSEFLEKSQESLKKLAEKKIEVEKKLLEVEKIKGKIQNKYAKIHKKIKKVKKLGENLSQKKKRLNFRKEWLSLKEDIRTTKRQVKELEQSYETEKVKGLQAIEDYKKEVDHEKENLNQEDYNSLKKSTETVSAESDETKNHQREREESVNKILETPEDDTVSEETMLESLNNIEIEEEKEASSVKKAKKELRKYEKELKGNTKETTKKSFWINVLAGDREVSEKKIEPTKWKTFEDNGNLAMTFEERALFFMYLQTHFDTYLSKEHKKKQKDESKLEKPEALDYGMEYIAIGKDSDEKNLKTIVTRIFGIRTAMWFSYYLSRADKVAEATSLALAAVGILGPIAVSIAKTTILMAWATKDAKTDTRDLLDGKEVALHPISSSLKIDYEKYVSLFLLMSIKSWGERSVKLIEQNMMVRYNKDFRADNCFSGVLGEIEGKVYPVLFQMGILEKTVGSSFEFWKIDFRISESLNR